MSKFTPLAIIFSVSGGTLGSYHYFPKQNNKEINSKLKTLFRDKYRFALLDTTENKDSSIWNKKWNFLKNKKPTHPKLKESVAKKSQESQSKKLHREACEEIYNSSIISTPYFLDFKYYCSKNNKDGIGREWIDEKSKDWDTKIIQLKNADRKGLQGSILELWNKLKSDSKNTKLGQNKKELQKWCDYFGSEIFFGKEVSDAKNAQQYCIK
ncbi:hypothetical protein MHC_01785 [Mycoplasma haemocanis str. Illinois]|uniref:Uncharacterized protein n=1 Tax=Mycoplasma haemocanis (strain Illinois) TaxID=1111676 RepID=H6N6F1_MYCHN|nr:hypothetical protein [Mycoplasma haemocanis]AEW45223.1 hypothetical protein MHC_01785 [Mycoplasma haemocanis str. Illinois]